MRVTDQPKISLSLDASDTTRMHRVGMAGLYLALKRLETKYPDSRQGGGNVSWIMTSQTIELFWEGNDFQALSWLFQESFQLDENGLIHLIGLENELLDLRQKIHIHEGMSSVFLRHNKFYKAGKQVKTKFKIGDQETEYAYKSLTWYAHQTFAEELCDEQTQELRKGYIPITSWLYLGGIVRHARAQKTKLQEKPEYALALCYVPMICQYCVLHLPSEDLKERKPHRYLVVIPEIQDFEDAYQRRSRLQQLPTHSLHVSSLGEAGLLYYSSDKIGSNNNYHHACEVWLYEKMNKTSRQRMLTRVEEIDPQKEQVITYQKVQKHFLPNYQHVLSNKILIKVNPVRSFIAENLVKGFPWYADLWSQFIDEDSKNYLFKQLLYNRKGVRIMIENSEVKEAYLPFINVFQHAMTVYFAKIYAKTEEGRKAPIDKKVERLRAELNSCYDQVSFQHYLADFLARGGLNAEFYQNQEKIFRLIEETPWEKLRIWALLAIASYQPKSSDNPVSIGDLEQTGE